MPCKSTQILKSYYSKIMEENKPQQSSELVNVLREAVSVVQMIVFKELRTLYLEKYPEKDQSHRAMLTGAVVNQLFGSVNPEPRFIEFSQDNSSTIEQELYTFPTTFSHLLPLVTDSLRIQVLCDSQQGTDSSSILIQAEKLGILLRDREVPLPSTFITLVRKLGEQHGLTIAPVEISPDENGVVH